MTVIYKDEKLKKFLSSTKTKLDNPDQVMEIISSKLWKEQVGHFNTGSGPDGPWEPLKASTIRQKKRQGYSSRPLIKTGKMRNELMFGHNKTEAFVRSSPATQNIGKYHQRGTSKMAARPYLYINPTTFRQLVQNLVNYILYKGNR